MIAYYVLYGWLIFHNPIGINETNVMTPMLFKTQTSCFNHLKYSEKKYKEQGYSPNLSCILLEMNK